MISSKHYIIFLWYSNNCIIVIDYSFWFADGFSQALGAIVPLF